MMYVDETTGVKLVIDEKVCRFYGDYISTYDFAKESGGIIIGTLSLAENKVFITDVTTPYKEDKRGTNYFKRAEFGHQEEMDSLWKKSKYRKTYLGEWHTHRQDVPIPSVVDIADWMRISKKDLNYKQPFFIIAGKTKMKVWTVSRGKIIEMKECE